MQIYSGSSYGKINLRLAVLGKRKDGYHEIRALLTRISLKDDLEIELIGEGITIQCSEGLAPLGAENLAFQAGQLFFKRLARPATATIRLTKRIPAGSGLGGGSSNAAATLLGLNQLFGQPFSKKEMMALATELGMDVPFFIYGAPALATGRGERLKPIKNLPFLSILLVVPPFRVATAEVYAQWRPGQEGGPELTITDFGKKLGLVLAQLRNDLEGITTSWHSEICQMKERLVSLGAQGASMSGSGGATYGIFSDQARAAEAACRLALPWGWRCFLVHNI